VLWRCKKKSVILIFWRFYLALKHSIMFLHKKLKAISTVSWPFLSVRTLQNAIERFRTVIEHLGTPRDARRRCSKYETDRDETVTGCWQDGDGAKSLSSLYSLGVINWVLVLTQNLTFLPLKVRYLAIQPFFKCLIMEKGTKTDIFKITFIETTVLCPFLTRYRPVTILLSSPRGQRYLNVTRRF
jgi:hypothetical protein